ncbi:hypothetical protein [Viridibacterium curvum]|uniref:Acetylhydrolase n=1 Tax=Viridibacterium curvum TaxID=1101404 RepID=A0ABP9QMH0_9RHOO
MPRRPLTSVRHPLWRIAALLGLLWTLAACMSPPQWAMAALPSQVRPDDSFSTLDLAWQDPTRDRAVPARLYLPSSAQTAPVPLVIFSHGLGGSREGYSYIGRDLAAHGMASLHVQHVGSDRALWQGNRLTTALRLMQAAGDDEAVARVQDLRFALDQLLASDYARQIDASRIAAAGHSYGANTTLLISGAQVQRDGETLQFRDPRIKAAVLISSPPFYGEPDFSPILQPIRLPSLHITSTADVINVPGYHSEAIDRIKVFDAIGSTQKLLAVFKGGSHSMFTDRLNTGGAELNPMVKQATRELVRLFLQEQFHLPAQRMALTTWRDRHAAILDGLRQGESPTALMRP